MRGERQAVEAAGHAVQAAVVVLLLEVAHVPEARLRRGDRRLQRRHAGLALGAHVARLDAQRGAAERLQPAADVGEEAGHGAHVVVQARQDVLLDAALHHQRVALPHLLVLFRQLLVQPDGLPPQQQRKHKRDRAEQRHDHKGVREALVALAGAAARVLRPVDPAKHDLRQHVAADRGRELQHRVVGRQVAHAEAVRRHRCRQAHADASGEAGGGGDPRDGV
mmetsp:Transcript_4561/g.11779  ORF Transcript_4561/g.11779 Transcript_4561/m.11779 type:complete len:222 (-) Transcript_4561:64-729(-)